jgi:hypothetical protein
MFRSSGDEIVRNVEKVIFPSNKWIKRWDMLVLYDVLVLLFIFPYEVGVSGCYVTVTSIPFLAFNVLLNAIIGVDTFLYFYRAYYLTDGHLELDLHRIRMQYLKSWFVPNFLSILPYTLGIYFVGNSFLESGEYSEKEQKYLIFLKIGDIFSLVRLYRLESILKHSDSVIDFRQKRNSLFELLKNSFLIVALSHWFACIWAFVAFLEARSRGQGLLERPNWIGAWYDANYVEGGPDPIGLQNHLDRYVISLFWAIQTITRYVRDEGIVYQ